MVASLKALQLHAVIYREVFLLSPGLGIIVAPNGSIYDTSLGLAEALQYNRRELEGRYFIDFVYHEDREATIAKFTELQDQKRVMTEPFSNRYVRKDGSLTRLEWLQEGRNDFVSGHRVAWAKEIKLDA